MSYIFCVEVLRKPLRKRYRYTHRPTLSRRRSTLCIFLSLIEISQVSAHKREHNDYRPLYFVKAYDSAPPKGWMCSARWHLPVLPVPPCGGIVCTQSRHKFTKHFNNNKIYIHFLHFGLRSEGGDAGAEKGGCMDGASSTHGRGSVDAWTRLRRRMDERGSVRGGRRGLFKGVVRKSADMLVFSRAYS